MVHPVEKDQAEVIERALNNTGLNDGTPTFPGTRLPSTRSSPRKAPKRVAGVINRHPHRASCSGTDRVAPKAQKSMMDVFHGYDPIWKNSGRRRSQTSGPVLKIDELARSRPGQEGRQSVGEEDSAQSSMDVRPDKPLVGSQYAGDTPALVFARSLS